MGDTFESNRPIARQPPSPVPGSDEQQDDRQRPHAGVERPEQECDRREDAPIGVINRHVLIKQSEHPDDDRG